MKIEIKESTEVKKPNYPYLAYTPDKLLVFVFKDGYRYANNINIRFGLDGSFFNEKHLTPLGSGSQVIFTQE